MVDCAVVGVVIRTGIGRGGIMSVLSLGRDLAVLSGTVGRSGKGMGGGLNIPFSTPKSVGVVVVIRGRFSNILNRRKKAGLVVIIFLVVEDRSFFLKGEPLILPIILPGDIPAFDCPLSFDAAEGSAIDRGGNPAFLRSKSACQLGAEAVVRAGRGGNIRSHGCDPLPSSHLER